MLDTDTLLIFFAASLALAFAPGPGMLYVLARTAEGGKKAGLLSTLGTALGGMVHVLAAAVGLSAILAASQIAFLMLKIVGGLYLIYLGFTILIAKHKWSGTKEPLLDTGRVKASDKSSTKNILIQGILTETFNPKTAVFFLAFIPQFVNAESGTAFFGFVVLGLIVVLLNAIPDTLIAFSSKPLGTLIANPLTTKIKQAMSGLCLIGLGIFMLTSPSGRRPL